MPCSSCGNTTPLVFDVQTFLNQSCSGNSQCFPAGNVCYSGPNLVCSGILTNDTLDDALTKIDEILCSSAQNYTAYQMNCLPAYVGAPIETEADFVDAITDYACGIRVDLDTFLDTTYPAYIATVNTRFLAIESPAITCASVGITNVDTLSTVYAKYCTKFTSIDTALDMSSVDFGGCFTVTVPPETVKEGFEEVLSQICQVKTLAESNGTTLPTFNNVGSCLATPTTTDSLVSTIGKIKTKLCTLPTWDSTALSWGCVGAPTTDLGNGIQKILDKVNYMLPKVVTFGAGFTTAPTNISDPCAGTTVTLSATTDRFVAATSGDVSPSTLDNKLVGVGIEVNTVDNANKITLKSDHKVLGALGDDTADYLINKLSGSTSNGVTITPQYNNVTKKIDLILDVDSSIFCDLLANCASIIPCASYVVTPLGTSALSYTDCSGSLVSLSISGPATVCAKLNTVYAPNATIVNAGSCSAPDVAVFSAINASTDLVISNITTGGSQFYTINAGSYNLTPSNTITGVGNTSGIVSVVVVSGTGSANLYRDNVLLETISLSGAGTYPFTAFTYTSTQDLKVIFTDTPTEGDAGTFTLNNLTSDVTVDGVTPAFFITAVGDFPALPSDTIISNGVTSAMISVIVTYSSGPARWASLFKNDIYVDSVSFTVTGTYDLPATTFTPSDVMRIDVTSVDPEA